jgi:hypothetical protein
MFKKTLMAAALLGASVTGVANAAILQNWYFDPDGAGSSAKAVINEYFDIAGPSYVKTSVPSGGNFSFDEWGAARVTGADSGIGLDAFLSTGEITATFTITGNGTLGGNVFYTGGSINVYSQAGSKDWSSTTGATDFYGANNGVLIGTFTPVTGGGLIDASGIPNGLQTISAQASFLRAGYWFGTDGTTDLSTKVSTGLLFGFATTNASRVTNPAAGVVSEIVNGMGGDPTFTNCLPGQVGGSCTGAGEFVISNNGQFRLVPEPAGIALLGVAFAAAGFASRRRSVK